MPLVKVEFSPGLNKDDTPLASEGGWIDADKVRFVRGKAQLIGGWNSATTQTFDGIVRGGHAWIDAAGRKCVAFGTAEKLYSLISGTITDITPPHSEGVLTNPFTTTNGSMIVTVAHTDHGMATGDVVTYANQSSSVGGLTLTGLYAVTYIDDNSYSVTTTGIASSTATGGGNVDYTIALPAGLESGTGEAGGYGTGGYGEGGYGATDASDTQPRIWSLDNWGSNLLAVPRGGGLYEFQPAFVYPELVTNGDFSSSTGWTLGTGWAVASGKATKTAGSGSDLSRPILVEGGKVYRVNFTISARSAGTLIVKTNTGLVGDTSATVSVNGTYSRLFRAPPGVTSIVLTADAAFNGSVDDLSVKLEDAAYRVDEAPLKNDAMFVDPKRIVVLIGTSQYTGTYNSMAVRWCDQEDLTDWTPTASNLAGDFLLAQGGRAISGLATRQQNLVWTDSALYTMRFTGDAASVYSFDLAGTGCGLIGPLAKAEQNGIAVWMSQENFFSFGGGSPEAMIACPLRRDVFEHISENQQEKCVVGLNMAFGEFWAFYPDSRDGSECSRYVIFNPVENHWSAGTFNRTTWIRAGVFNHPIAFGTDGMVYFHEDGQSANGGVISAFLESAYADIGDGENMLHLRAIVPDFEDAVGPISFTLYTRRWPNAPEVTYGPATYSPATDTDPLRMRITARQVKWRLDTASTPAFWRAGSIKVDLMPGSARR